MIFINTDGFSLQAPTTTPPSCLILQSLAYTFSNDLGYPEETVNKSDSTSRGSGTEEDHNHAQDYHLGKIGGAVQGSKAVYCCAGNGPITEKSPFEEFKATVHDTQLTSPRVLIRWDHKDGKSMGKLTFPPKSYHGNAKDQVAFKQFVEYCTPAVFGKDGKDVLDELYRKAVKLDIDQFSTSFSSYDIGIISAISQTIMPGIAKLFADDKRTLVSNLGVVAELYKLNVCTQYHPSFAFFAYQCRLRFTPPLPGCSRLT